MRISDWSSDVCSSDLFITSVQQIFFDVFKLPQLFSYAFAGIAGFMAVGSFFNSRLVERIGARRLSQGSLIIFILLSGVHVAIATAGFENAWSFCALQAATMLRSEEHTSELQSLMRISYAVFCLKNKTK